MLLMQDMLMRMQQLSQQQLQRQPSQQGQHMQRCLQIQQRQVKAGSSSSRPALRTLLALWKLLLQMGNSTPLQQQQLLQQQLILRQRQQQQRKLW
jgi:hypothetical protein